MTNESDPIAFPEARVTGVVRFRDGLPAEGYRVKAFDRSLDDEHELGDEVTTRAGGVFKIKYPIPHRGTANSQAADVVVKVFDGDGLEVATSRLFPAAIPFLTVQLQIDQRSRKSSEFDDLSAAIAPRLNGKSIADLTPANIKYLAAVTGQDSKRIELLARSARCRSALSSGPARLLPESAFYAWLSLGSASGLAPADPGLPRRRNVAVHQRGPSMQ